MYSWEMAGAKPVIQDDAGDCTVTIGSSGYGSKLEILSLGSSEA